MSSKKQNYKVYSAGILLILLVLCFFLYLRTPVVLGNQSLCLVVKPGETFDVFSKDLSQHSRLNFPIWFRWYAKITGKSRYLKLGEYCFLPGSNPKQILNKVIHGRVVVHSFTIVDGWTFKQLEAALDKDDRLVHTLDQYSLTQLLKHFELVRETIC